MSIHKVLRMGDTRLLRVAEAVTDFHSAELAAIIEDMFETMAAYDGAGLAAPQIGINQRIVIFGVDKNPRYPDAETVPMTVLINPEITILSAATDRDWEGCLSVPGMRGVVSRYTHIRYRGFDATGNAFEREARGFHARVVQHETDHLDGILYPQRMTDMRQFGYVEELMGKRIAEPGPCDRV